MTIAEWLDQDEMYQEGVSLYESYPKHNKSFLRSLKRKYSLSNLIKLRYELSRINDSILINQALNTSEKKDVDTHDIVVLPPLVLKEKKYDRDVLISDLPTQLHTYYIKQKTDFNTACSLKVRLNNLLPEQEPEALEIILEIDRLFNSIEKTWKIIDYYLEFNYIPNLVPLDIDNIPSHLWTQTRQNYRSQRTRAEKRIKKLAAKLSTLSNQSEITKVENQLSKVREKVMNFDQYIISLTDKIDSRNYATKTNPT